MDTNILENIILPFEFPMIGLGALNIAMTDPKTWEIKERMNIVMDETPIEILCIRWSARPDLIAGSPRLTSNSTDISEAVERATAILRRLYTQKSVPWPDVPVLPLA